MSAERFWDFPRITESAESARQQLEDIVMTRETTVRILEMLDEGILNRDIVIMACLKYMSEDDVADMAQMNGFLDDEEQADE